MSKYVRSFAFGLLSQSKYQKFSAELINTISTRYQPTFYSCCAGLYLLSKSFNRPKPASIVTLCSILLSALLYFNNDRTSKDAPNENATIDCVDTTKPAIVHLSEIVQMQPVIPGGQQFFKTDVLLAKPKQQTIAKKQNISMKSEPKSNLQKLGDIAKTIQQNKPSDQKTTQKQTLISGNIGKSFPAAARKIGVPDSIIQECLHLFSMIGARTQGKFELLYELVPITKSYKATKKSKKRRKTVASGPVFMSKLLYVAVESTSKANEALKIYRHTARDGTVGYFRQDGASITPHSTTLRVPVDRASISSGYGMRRHPVFHRHAMHTGVDYRAPRGTQVKSAGDGFVHGLGYHSGGYGNFVEIKHSANYSTFYAHLDRQRHGLIPGMRVRQGELIGYVGRTGRATGEHLHFEVREGGRPVNPMRVLKLAPQILSGKQLSVFRQQQRTVDTMVRQQIAQRSVLTLAG